MEQQPPSDENTLTRQYNGVEVRLEILPGMDERDVVLMALKQMLGERVINIDEYQERRRAYLSTFLPLPPDIAA